MRPRWAGPRWVGLRWVTAVPAAVVVLYALVGPLLSGRSTTTSVGAPYSPSGPGLPLGTDGLGRDVLARVQAGGLPVVVTAAGATALSALLGVTVGVLAAVAAPRLGRIVMRGVDVLVVLPALVLVLVLAAGFPGSDVAVLVAVAVTTAPFSARVTHAAAGRVATAGWVEVARTRGDPVSTVLVRDVLPAVLGVVLADTGLRFVAALYLTSTAGFLGLGASAPAANWGRMVSENTEGLTLNPWPVLVPVLGLVLLTVSVNRLADRVARSGGSRPGDPR